jgi:branched-chain amino acid transport system ATP-binding protein
MTPGNGNTLLQAQGITCRYGGLIAVSQLSFEIHHREILGLIGPNGAGKSTTFNMLTGFRRPSAGQITFQGWQIDRQSPEQIARLGLVRTFQHGSIFRGMTVYDNILMGIVGTKSRIHPSESDRRVRDAAAMFNLTGVLDEAAAELPHGHQRLLSIAIALGPRPRLLCLDEPLTGLNQTEVNAALGIVRRLRDELDVSILFVEHNMKAVLSICDRIVVLDAGRHLASGSPQEVSTNPAVIAAYLGAPQ